MQMEKWQDAAAEQAKLLAVHFNEILSKALKLLHSELGVDLGLKPEAIPLWVILFAAGTGLLLLLALWASLCCSVFKKRQSLSSVDEAVVEKQGVAKPIKSEEPKKKKKKAEKVGGAWMKSMKLYCQPTSRALARLAVRLTPE